MALAPFFDKTALAAAAILRGFSRDDFALALEAHVIGIAFDDVAVSRFEGCVMLRLVANLLARLYPRVALLPAGDAAREFAPELTAILRAVNPDIEVVSPTQGTLDRASLDVALVVGDTPINAFGVHPATAVYVGSAGWEARVSTNAPVGVGASILPFGAGAAACVGAANVFRCVFASQLANPAPDKALTVSMLSLEVRHAVSATAVPTLDPTTASELGRVDLGEVVQVGGGAVGQGALWTLAYLSGVDGTVHLVDGETIDATNPQRYILSVSEDEGRPKVDLAAEWFGAAQSNGTQAVPAVRERPGARLGMLKLVPHRMRWGGFLARRSQPWRLRRVLVALDSARDRIAVQASLPAWVANAWTQPGDLGVSRHAGLGGTACLACLYLPNAPSAKHEDVLVAEAVGLGDQLMLVRTLLATNAPVDEETLRLIAERLGVSAEALLDFRGRPLRAFYSEAVCGGVVLRLRSTAVAAPDLPAPAPGASHEASQVADGSGRPTDRAAMVPMAFQSVLAGVLVAAALVADAAGLPAPKPGQKAVLDLLRPISPRLLVPAALHPSGKCLCQDPLYQAVYRARWNDDAATGDRGDVSDAVQQATAAAG